MIESINKTASEVSVSNETVMTVAELASAIEATHKYWQDTPAGFYEVKAVYVRHLHSLLDIQLKLASALTDDSSDQ